MVIVRKVGFNAPSYTNIYVGRKSSYKPEYGLDGSSLGNPFWMKDESMRDLVCDQYEEYFVHKLLKEDKVVKSLQRLSERIKNGEHFALICFCYPKRCHANTIRKYLLSL